MNNHKVTHGPRPGTPNGQHPPNEVDPDEVDPDGQHPPNEVDPDRDPPSYVNLNLKVLTLGGCGGPSALNIFPKSAGR